MKRIKLPTTITMLLTLMYSVTAWGIEYAPLGGGNWTNLSNWVYWNGSAWVAASSLPGPADGAQLVNASASSPITVSANTSVYLDFMYLGSGGDGDTDRLDIYGWLDLDNAGGVEYNGLWYGSYWGNYDADSTVNVYSGATFDMGYITIINANTAALNKVINYGGNVFTYGISLNNSKLAFEVNAGTNWMAFASPISNPSASKLTVTLFSSSSAMVIKQTDLTSLISAGCIVAQTTTVTSGNRSTLLNEDTTTIPGWDLVTLKVSAPGAATNPTPANGAASVSLTSTLNWTAGSGATSHNVYFGTSSPGTFQGNQSGTTFNPGTMAAGTTYYWRIDEVNAYGTNTGTVWSFTTVQQNPPGAASSPLPSDNSISVSVKADLSWTAGSGATSHDVYFGTVNPPPFVANQWATSYDPGTLATNTTYYWRIDEVNAYGTTTGTVWDFTTDTNTIAAVAYWTMDDNAANATVADSSGNNRNGTFYSGTGTQNTTVGHSDTRQEGTGSLNFDGINDYAIVTGYKGVTGTASRTCVAWVKTAATQQGSILCWGSTSGGNGKNWNFRVENGGQLAVGVFGGWIKSTSTILSNNQWHHVAAVLTNDGSPNVNEVKLYIDGVQQATTVSGSLAINTSSLVDVVIGAFKGVPSDAPNMYFKGLLDDVRIYDSALTTAQIQDIYNLNGYNVEYAINPDPANGATDISIVKQLSWRAGMGATSHNVYFGTNNPPTTLITNQAATAFNPGALKGDTTYYWRVDEVNANGTNTGSVWSFTTMYRLDPNDFLLSPWDSPWNTLAQKNASGQHYTVANCQIIADCGFNLAGFVPAKYPPYTNLDNAATAGLKAFAFNDNTAPSSATMANWPRSTIDSYVNPWVAAIQNHPGTFGYYLQDEPPANYWPGLGQFFESMTAADPTKKVYLSLGWDYDYPTQMTYAPNSYLSYDWYDVTTNNTWGVYYFPCLEKARYYANYYNVPFHAMGASVEMAGWYAPPNLANLRGQLYTSLAYGIRGFYWFTYFSGSANAPIVNGNKTPLWTSLQTVNNQMNRIGKTYITLTTSCNTFHHPTVPSGQPYMNYPSKGIAYSWYVSNITGGDYVVGEFYDAAYTPFLLVANKSLTSNATISITLKAGYTGTLYRVNSATGQLQTLSSNPTLLPGEGALLKLVN